MNLPFWRTCIHISLVFFSLQTFVDSQLRCRKCDDVKTISECDTLELCHLNEHCLTESVIRQCETFYNSRCVPANNCSSTHSTTLPYPVGRRFLTDTVVCSECCSQKNCDTTGCGLRGLECNARLNDGYFYDSLTGIYAKVVKSPGRTYSYNQTEAAAVCDRDGAKMINDLTEHLNRLACAVLPELECNARLKDGYFYDSLTGICAKVVKSPNRTYNQTEAAAVCNREGAKLITISSEEQQYFLLSWIFTRYERDVDFWIGLEASNNTKNHYEWPRGQPISYKYWGRAYPEQPSGKWTGDENCVFINSKDDNSWHDERCDRMLSGYICEIWNLIDISRIQSVCRQKVFQGYLYDQRNNMCIKLREGNTAKYTRQMAVEDCKQDGATLAIIDTAEKSTMVDWWIYSTRGNGTDFWIGAYDSTGNTSIFTWPNGANVSAGFTNWGGPDFSKKLVTQPDGTATSSNQSCVYMDHLYEYKWFDENCGRLKNGFICQHFGNISFLSHNIDNCLYRLQRGYFYDPCTRMCVQIKSSNPVPRAEADRICRLNGDRLVEIDTEEKMTYLTYLAQSVGKSNNDFWIGAIGSSQIGAFEWENTNRPLNYTNWYVVQPKPVRNCVVLDHTDRYRWTPTQCSDRKHGFVCQLDNIALANL